VKWHHCFADDYFESRLPIVSRRIAQGGVRLAMFLNRIFGHGHHNHVVRSVVDPIYVSTMAQEHDVAAPS